MRRSLRVAALMVVFALLLAACQVPVAAPQGAAPAAGAGGPADGQWCKGMKIRFFVGGNEGTPFAKIVDLGAHAATKDLGADVDFVYSNWENEKMLSQLRDAIAARPHGIAFMGHAGDDAVMPLAKEASEAGILMMYQNVDVPNVRATYGGGYVGANLASQGRALAAEAIRTLELDKDSFVSERLRAYFSDLVYRVKRKDGGGVFIQLLLEHKSAPERWTALQLLGYQFELWERAKETCGDKLPLVLPVVIYHGQRRWNVPLSFRALVAGAEAPPWQRYVPEFEYHLCDLARLRDEQLGGSPDLRTGLLLLKNIFAQESEKPQ